MIAVAAMGLARQSLACEPVIPFIQVVAPALALSGSIAALGAAVLLKSMLFALFEKRILFFRGALFMFLGNIVTSFIGLIAAAMIGSGGVWAIGVPIVFFLSWWPARRIVAAKPGSWFTRMSPGGIATLLTAALCVSCIFFSIGQAAILANRLALYWIIKLLAVYIALVASIALTATWEEWAIWRLAAKPENTAYFGAVIRANVYVLVFIMAFGAVIMLPRRLKSPDFLTKRHPVRLVQVR